MISKINILEDVLIIGGISISISMIQSILGIIILSVQIILIIVKGVMKIYNAIKNKNMDEIDNIMKETSEDLEKLSGKDKDEQ